MIEPLPLDSDVDLHDKRQQRELHWDLLVAIAVGGAVGASARFGISLLIPPTPRGFPWAIFGINVLGSLLIGILMVLIADHWPDQRLIRPFFGVGILGGFTTFSTYVVDIQRLVNEGAAGIGLAYLAGTLVAAVTATQLGIGGTRRVLAWRAA